VLAFAPWSLEPFHAFKAVILRAIGFAVLAWVAVDAAVGGRRRPGALVLAVAAWVGASALATLASISPRLSLLGEPSQREGLLTTLAIAGFHLAARRAHRDERDVNATLTTVLLCGVAAAVYAQLQLAGLDPFHPQGEHAYAASTGAAALRPSGPLGNPTLLGAVLAAALPLALVRLASSRGDAWRLVPAAALIGASLWMTLSRGAWLAAAVALVVAAVAARLAGAAPRRMAWTWAASLLPALLVAWVRASGPIVARLAEGAHGTASIRVLIARGALALWRGRPWLGVGPDAFGLAYPRIQPAALWHEEWVGHPVHAHAVPLQVLATLGAVGALAGLAWLLAAGRELRLAWREDDRPESRAALAAVAGALAALVVAGLTNVVGLAGASLFAVLTALPAALRAPAADAASQPAPATSRVRALLPALAAAAASVVALAFGTRELVAFSLAHPALEIAPRGDAATAASRALAAGRAASVRRAAALLPGEDALWGLACDASLAASDALGSAGMNEAIAGEHAARRALALEPARAVHLERLADALADRAIRSGAVETADSAEAMYQLARDAAPADGWLLVSQIRFHLARRDGERALAMARELVSLYPEAAVGHSLAGAALLLLGRADQARAELERARASRWEEDALEQRAMVEQLLARLDSTRVASPAPAPPRP